MKTKEEILETLWKEKYPLQKSSYSGSLFKSNEKWVTEAMSIFAKQEAIEYAKFRDDYRHIESMNWKHNVTDKIGITTWVGASDDKIYEAYKEGKQLLRWIEDPNHPDNMLQNQP